MLIPEDVLGIPYLVYCILFFLSFAFFHNKITVYS